MGVNTIFGINGIGKDTVAEELRKRNPNIKVTSMSRLLMYLLGISKTYDVREKITESQYKLLEKTPQSTIREIENKEYRELLEQMANSEEDILFLAHLVSALRLGQEITYLKDKTTPQWFVEENKHLIQLVAPASVISQRRKNDHTRKREVDIAQILEHQGLCSKEWERIAATHTGKRKNMHIVENMDLEKTIAEIEGIIYERDTATKKCRNDFIQSLKYQPSTDRNNIFIPQNGTCVERIEIEGIGKENENGDSR